MVVSFLLMAVTAAMAKPCFTKEEARKQWPNERLYWHTERHCWDQIKRTSGTYRGTTAGADLAGRQRCSGSAAKAGDEDERKEPARTRNFLSKSLLRRARPRREEEPGQRSARRGIIRQMRAQYSTGQFLAFARAEIT